MTHAEMRREPQPSAAALRLQHLIDSGRTGEKVAGFDPAAAPLGTDDEAGGAPPSALAPERLAPGRDSANAATPELAPDGRQPPQQGLLLAGLAGAAAGLALISLLAAAL